MRRRTFLAGSVAGLASAVLLGPRARAETYPNHPVRIVVPYPAGQGTDVFARRFAEYLQRTLGQPFVVENRAGAGGNIGTAAVARAQPDGYTLLWGTNATHAANEFLYPTLGFDPVKDFEPVASVLSLGMVVYVKEGSDIRSLADLIARAKADPGRVLVGGPSTTARAVLQMLNQAAGVEFFGVPYTGSAQAMTSVLNGDITAAVDTIAASLGPIRGNQVRPLAVSLPKRSESLPQTPTFRDAGVNLEVEAWNACYVPRGTPEAIVATLNKAINAGLNDPTLRAALVRDGAEPTGGPPQQLAAMMQTDRAKWGPAIKSLNLTSQ